MRALVVDDEQRLARSLRVGLEAEGFAVDVAHDGVDGLWLARENEYDVIVLDLMLPGINGYKVCQALRDGEELDPDPDAHRQGRRVGPGGGAGHRSRRLPDQAVLVPGAGRATACRGPSWRPRAADPARGRGPATGPGGPAGLARGGRAGADLPGVLRCWRSSRATRATSCPSARSSTPCGTWTSRGTRTSSRSTSATSATRSTGRSVARRSRPCAERAIDWAATVAEGRLGRASVRAAHHGRGSRGGGDRPDARGVRAGHAGPGLAARRPGDQCRAARLVARRPDRELRPAGAAAGGRRADETRTTTSPRTRSGR